MYKYNKLANNFKLSLEVELFGLYQQSYEVAPDLFGAQWTQSQFVEELKVVDVYTVTVGAALAGFIFLRPIDAETSEITWLCLDLNYQKQGHMQGLLKYLLKAESTKKIWLEVYENNAKACNLYVNCGFVETGRRSNYYGAAKHALLLEAN